MTTYLTPDQEQALISFKCGNNIFLTGPGGSGKSYLIKKIVDECKKSDRKVQVCAMTGCAAILLNCGAKTLHSWGGFGLGNGDVKTVVKRVTGNKYKKKPWKDVDVLIIDEVSMLSKKLLTCVDYIARICRNNRYTPFGGLQVILSGDFYQLPPVGDEENEETTAFCFESEAWQGIDDICQLSTIKRQDDQKFAKILNQVRIGKITKSTITALTSRIGSTVQGDLKPTVMFPRRFHADQVNNREYRALPDIEEFTYERAVVDDVKDLSVNDRKNRALASPEALEHEVKYLSSGTMAEHTISLKIGTQVMCIANIDMDSEHQIVNGSQGIVIGFQAGLPVVQFRTGVVKLIGKHLWQSETIPGLSIQQIPLIYSWAITIHKAQGVTLEVAEIDAGSHIFECGQTYVALSRVKSIDGLRLTSFDYRKIRVNKKVKDFYNSIV